MTKIVPSGIRKTKVGLTVLGLSFEEGLVEVAEVRRTNGSVEVRRQASLPLSLNLLTDAPELVGHEIRKQLDAAGMRAKRCVVCLPQGWVLTHQVTLPDLPPADQDSLLEIEAENGFPDGAEALVVRRSRFRTPSGAELATLVAVSRDRVNRMEQVLKAAQLRPCSFTLGLPALCPGTRGDEGALALAVGMSAVGMQLALGGGIVVLRGLESGAGGDPSGSAGVSRVVREIRITLGQLPEGLAGAVRRVEVFGSIERADELATELYGALRPMGLVVERVKREAAARLPLKVPDGATISPGLAGAVRHLAGEKPELEFLPPRVPAWQRFMDRHASRKVATASMVALGLAVVVLGSFLVQQWQLSRWGSRWAALRPRVVELEKVQQQRKAGRPWFDESVRSLSILRRLAESFPEDGSVSAKNVEMRGSSMVSCSGTARDNQSLLRTLDRLRECKEIKELKVEQIRGRSPVQYTFNFQWMEGVGP